MFRRWSETKTRILAEGVEQRTLTYGERMLMSAFELKKGAKVDTHSHPHEQIGYLIKGKLKFVVDNEEIIAQTGDSWCIPSGVEHSAEALEKSLIVEVFSPPREDFM